MPITENEVQNRIRNNQTVQNGINNILNLQGNVEYSQNEEEFINSMYPDFVVRIENTIEALIECKAGDINVTDYVRGIGQLLQYEYYAETSVPHRGNEYSPNFKTVYFYPSTVVQDHTYNIGRFKYPRTTIIMELNDTNNAVREISRDELSRLEKAEDDNLVTVSQYYFRDNRLYEYYILLKYIMQREDLGAESIDRNATEINFLRRINTQNNNNWRNAFITLSNLGFINRGTNLTTLAGRQMAILPYKDFVVKMYHAYLQPYSELFIECFNKNEYLNADNQAIAGRIKQRFNDRDVLYVTESNGRYISSWMNIFRDDLGMIEFKPYHSERRLQYIPSEYTDDAFANRVLQYTKAQQYINNYIALLREGI